MAISEKIIPIAKRVRRLLFLGRPAYFNAVDLNNELEILHQGIADSMEKAGVFVDGLSYEYFTMTIIDEKVTVALKLTGGTLLYQGTKIPLLPDSNPVVQNETYSIETGIVGKNDTIETVKNVLDEDGTIHIERTKFLRKSMPKPVYFCAKFKLANFDFATDPNLCGIQSDEYPYQVPSCSAEAYTAPEFLITDDVEYVKDADTDYLVVILSTAMPRVVIDTGEIEYFRFDNTVLEEDIKLNLTGMETGYEVEVGDNFYFSEDHPNDPELQENGSLLELVKNFMQYTKHRVGTMRKYVTEEILRSITEVQARLNRFSSDIDIKIEAHKAELDARMAAVELAQTNYENDFDEKLKEASPLGLIAMWYKGSIPTGWRQCTGSTYDSDGTSVVSPDLTDKFVVCKGSEFKDTGGQSEITLTKANLPTHTHKLVDGEEECRMVLRKNSANKDGSLSDNSGFRVIPNSNTHTVSATDLPMIEDSVRLPVIKSSEFAGNLTGKIDTDTIPLYTVPAYDLNTSSDPKKEYWYRKSATTHTSRGEYKHDHEGNTGDGSLSGLSGKSFETIPPYFALTYIIRVP